MKALALAALLAAAASAAPAPDRYEPRIDVLLLTKLHPASATVTGPQQVAFAIRDRGLLVDGAACPSASFALPDAIWTVRVPRAAARTYRGRLQVSVRNGELQLVASLRLDDYVAEAVASETTPGTPLEALKAQAVVSRSYARATMALEPQRHDGAHVCDLAHCQVLRGSGAAAHRAAAQQAALATAGEVLRLESGAVALAPFHAACAGHTADPTELFGGPDASGAAAVADPGCASAWTAELTEAHFQDAARRAFGSGGTVPKASELRYERGAGGYVTRVVDPAGGRVASGDAFARALDAELRWRGVRSSRFTAAQRGSRVRLTGSGIGHGVGLCQAGAARMARQGSGYRAILARFFPRARVGPPITSPAAARP